MTHAELIDSLGGTSFLYRHLGVASRQVCHGWKVNGIPWKWRFKIAKMAKARKLPLPEKFFG